MNHTFPVVSIARAVKGNCPVCGKSNIRRQRFEHTVNPFNRNADGAPKTREEVFKDVQEEANAWRPDHTHRACAA